MNSPDFFKEPEGCLSQVITAIIVGILVGAFMAAIILLVRLFEAGIP